MLQYLRRPLERLLSVSVESEKTHRERKLAREIARQSKQMLHLQEEHDEALLMQAHDYDEALRVLHAQLSDCHSRISRLEDSNESKDREKEFLEHQIELLQQDVNNLTAVNARMLKWVETLRSAEEAPPANLLARVLNEKAALPYATAYGDFEDN